MTNNPTGLRRACAFLLALLALLLPRLAAADPNASAAPAPAVAPTNDPLPVAVSFRDPALHYQGRFASDESGTKCAWPASAVTIRFRGDSVNVRLSEAGSDRYQVIVDGKPTITLTPTGPDRLYRLASNLSEGEHTVTLAKRTEAFVGTGTIHGFQLSAGAELLTATPPTRRIEVIGDSISAGYGNEAANQNQHFSAETENVWLTYGGIAARAVGGDYTCIAWSGKKLWPDNSIVDLYDRVLPLQPQPLWDFAAAPKPDAVLVNLGTNDFNGPNPDEEKWVAAYLAFLQQLRTRYPNAYIYCAVGTMMNDAYPAGHNALTTIRGYLKRVEETRRSQGDTRIRVLDFGTQNPADGLGGDWHPSIRTHQKMADKFVQALAADLGWSTTEAGR